MPRHNRILVCVDGHKAGFHALCEAIHLAQWTHARVTVLTVTLFFEGDLSLVGVRNLDEALKGPAEKILRQASQIAKDRHLPIEIICEEGHAGKKIAACADALKADLVVVGADRQMGWVRFIIESTLCHLLLNVGADLMVVPEDTHFAGDNFLVVLDGSSRASNLLLPAMDILGSFGGKNIFKAMPAGIQESISQDQGKVSNYPKNRSDQTESGCLDPFAEPENLIYKDLSDMFRHAKDHHTGLIVMGKKVYADKIRLARSRIESLIRRSSSPVLFLP
jgi:nucleotide-binding universal stress UspA family protein